MSVQPDSSPSTPVPAAADYHIVVNGRPKTITQNVLSFDDVVKLAFANPPFGENTLFTISYRNAADDKQGTLVEGKTVIIRNGTIFNVTATDKS